VSAGLVFASGASFGSADASLLAPNGSAFVLYHTTSRLAPGMGFDLHVGTRVTSRLWAELTGGLRHAQIETTTSGDFEGATPATLTESTSRFSIEGAALWCVPRSGHVEPFVRGSAGWTRELSSDGALARNGLVASAGGGVKYWVHESARGFVSRVGVRLDAAAVLRHGGISLSTRTKFVSASFAGSVILGW
jgi:hypothetical protein